MKETALGDVECNVVVERMVFGPLAKLLITILEYNTDLNKI